MGSDGTDGFAHGTLQSPDRQSPEPDARLVGMARQSTSPRALGLLHELEATGQENGDHQVNKGFALPQPIPVGGLIVKIDDNSTVLAAARGRLLFHGTSPHEAACPCAMPRQTTSFSAGVDHNVLGGLAHAGARGLCCRCDMASGSGIGVAGRSGYVETIPGVLVPCPFLPRVQMTTLGMTGATTKFGGIWQSSGTICRR
jgi:hypothetical protein